jgi:hypothetical protein
MSPHRIKSLGGSEKLKRANESTSGKVSCMTASKVFPRKVQSSIEKSLLVM